MEHKRQRMDLGQALRILADTSVVQITSNAEATQAGCDPSTRGLIIQRAGRRAIPARGLSAAERVIGAWVVEAVMHVCLIPETPDASPGPQRWFPEVERLFADDLPDHLHVGIRVADVDRT
jgi:hypothetical protein